MTFKLLKQSINTFYLFLLELKISEYQPWVSVGLPLRKVHYRMSNMWSSLWETTMGWTIHAWQTSPERHVTQSAVCNTDRDSRERIRGSITSMRNTCPSALKSNVLMSGCRGRRGEDGATSPEEACLNTPWAEHMTTVFTYHRYFIPRTENH